MKIIDKKKYEADSYQPYFAFWKERLTKFDHEFAFKQKSTRPNSGNYSSHLFSIDDDVPWHIQNTTKGNDAALLTYVLASFGLLLKRYRQCDTLIVDVPSGISEGGVHTEPVPVVFEINEAISFRDCLRSVNGQVKETYRYAGFPLQMLGESGYFKTNVLLYVEGLHGQLPETSKYDLILKVGKTSEGIEFNLLYDDSVFDNWYINNLGSHYNTLLKSLQDTDIILHKADMVGAEEKRGIFQAGTGAKNVVAATKRIHELFEDISTLLDHKTAVIHNGNKYSYRYINQRSDELAGFLINYAGVKTGDTVCVCMDRSELLVISIMAIFKAGAVYVPIDIANSAFRRDFIIKDSKAVVLLTLSKYVHGVKELPLQVLALDEKLPLLSGNNLKAMNTVNPDGYAYIIYTSGTTGVPKGVLIKQHSILNTIYWRNEYYSFSANDTILQIPSIGFDSSIEDLLCAMLSGATLLIPDEEERTNVAYLADLIVEFDVTHFLITPSLYNILLDHLDGRSNSLKNITIAGEAVFEEIVKKHYRILPDVLLINEYGPAENSVCTTAGKLINGGEITIGRPIGNVYLYILDNCMRVVPAGVPGEIYIGGAGLCDGYLSNEELNKTLFGVDPFRLDGTLLYKSGDFAQWLPDGNIQFLGRTDDQVKLNGIRIEPAEIEAVVRGLHLVHDCKVIPLKNDDQTITLKCAVIPADNVHDQHQFINEARSACERLLPVYMIPSAFLILDEFPLTLHGKIDNKNILSLFEKQNLHKRNVVLPSTEPEKLLATIWSATIGTSPIGIHENFFQIGGDSIKAIQIASRLYKEGFKIEVRDIFEKRTIYELAKVVRPLKNLIDQFPVAGPIISLTPIQKELFLTNALPHHFNQAIMLSSKIRTEAALWRTIAGKLQEHHDALRITFHLTDNGWTAYNQGLQHPVFIQEFDNVTIEEIQNISNDLQKSIDLEKGPLLKTALFHLHDGDRILIVAHHTIIDGISWRILIEDIGTLFEQIRNGDKLSLPPKTDSFKKWVETVHAYAESSVLKTEMDYWTSVVTKRVDRLTGDLLPAVNDRRMACYRSASVELDEAATRLLITEVNIPFNTEVNDILLVSLALAMQEVFAVSQLQIDLEGHGRENIVPEIDITRTVGWFTSICPVVLAVSSSDPGKLIIETKEYLRAIPFHGIGYGILKHLSSLTTGNKAFARQSQVLFNYLGQFDEDIDNSMFNITTDLVGDAMSADIVTQYDFVILGLISGKKLSISIDFNSHIYKLETIERLLRKYKEHMLRMINYCVKKDSREITPSDTSSKGLSMQDMEEIKSIFNR
jgi:amino acid adenylation domain-containing protein/non-ribosomal peptide synthase protein (TIGR01720 family)